jgi:putative heme iron utilization protein
MENLDRHADARALLCESKAGVLSTLSVEAEGYPFGSVVPYCLDRRGRPVVLVSEIAQHTRNIDADPRVCLTVLAGGEDIQASARLSVLARAARVEDGLEDVAERYTRHFPGSRDYHRVHAFVFARLEPTRLRWIGGFGDIRWIEAAELLVENPFSRAQETAIVEHMNDDHAPTMRGYCRRLAGLPVADDEPVTMAGIDAEGFDLRVGDRPLRVAFPVPATTPAEARERLVALAR